MDVLLQNHDAKRVFPVPEGLRELSNDIVREVLRHQPECMYTFIAEYLETMMIIREKARDSNIIISDIFREAYFYENICRTKNVTRQEINECASIIQAAWRGYTIRKKLRSYLAKRKRIERGKEMKKAIKMEKYLESIGITYEEANRAAWLIQTAYRQAKRGKWVTNEFGGVTRTEEDMPPGQRMRKGYTAGGRYDREDFRNFLETNKDGDIMYKWPRCGQLRKIPRKMLQPDMSIVTFFATRDPHGQEQYCYLIKVQKGENPRGFPIGFLIPIPKGTVPDESSEVKFVNEINNIRMGNYTYVFEKRIEKLDLNHFANLLDAGKDTGTSAKSLIMEIPGELEYDPDWVVPKIMIQINKNLLTEMDDEVFFVDERFMPKGNDTYTFRAENREVSLKVINYLMKSKCMTMEEAIREAENLPEYKCNKTGRFLPAEDFEKPKYIQKIVITPETETGKLENDEMDNFEYVFVHRDYKWRMRVPKSENPARIPVSRFRGYRNDHGERKATGDKIFVMGPMLDIPDCESITAESVFPDELGHKSWYQLLCTTSDEKTTRLGETPTEEEQVEENSGSEEMIGKSETEMTGEKDRLVEVETIRKRKSTEMVEILESFTKIEPVQTIRPEDLPQQELQQNSEEGQEDGEQTSEKSKSESEEEGEGATAKGK